MQILLSKNLCSTSEHDEISVMRFKTYGLYIRSALTVNGEDEGTWCRLEFPSSQANHTDDPLSLDVRCVGSIEEVPSNDVSLEDYVQRTSIMLISLDSTIRATHVSSSLRVHYHENVFVCPSKGIWPSEEVLAYYCFKCKDLFE